MTLLWATLALVSGLEDDTGCLDALVLERELQARAPAAEIDVRVTRTPEGRLAHVVVKNLSPPVKRDLAIRDVECAELPDSSAIGVHSSRGVSMKSNSARAAMDGRARRDRGCPARNVGASALALPPGGIGS